MVDPAGASRNCKKIERERRERRGQQRGEKRDEAGPHTLLPSWTAGTERKKRKKNERREEEECVCSYRCMRHRHLSHSSASFHADQHLQYRHLQQTNKKTRQQADTCKHTHTRTDGCTDLYGLRPVVLTREATQTYLLPSWQDAERRSRRITRQTSFFLSKRGVGRSFHLKTTSLIVFCRLSRSVLCPGETLASLNFFDYCYHHSHH